MCNCLVKKGAHRPWLWHLSEIYSAISRDTILDCQLPRDNLLENGNQLISVRALSLSAAQLNGWPSVRSNGHFEDVRRLFFRRRIIHDTLTTVCQRASERPVWRHMRGKSPWVLLTGYCIDGKHLLLIDLKFSKNSGMIMYRCRTFCKNFKFFTETGKYFGLIQ
jgi:hypothetical protein